MPQKRIIGFVLLGVGIVLLIVGLNASDSPTDQISETFTGEYTDRTMYYIIGGIAAIIGGGLMALMGRK